MPSVTSNLVTSSLSTSAIQSDVLKVYIDGLLDFAFKKSEFVGICIVDDDEIHILLKGGKKKNMRLVYDDEDVFEDIVKILDQFL